MARARIVGGVAVGAQVGNGLQDDRGIVSQAKTGDTTAGWAFRWFIGAALFLLFFGVIAARGR